MNERKPILEKGHKMTLPIPLFLFVLKELKLKNKFDSMSLDYFKRICISIFGEDYCNGNWLYAKDDMLANGWIEIFSTCINKEEFYLLVRITDKGMWLIENGVSDDWCSADIKRVIANIKIEEVLKVKGKS